MVKTVRYLHKEALYGREVNVYQTPLEEVIEKFNSLVSGDKVISGLDSDECIIEKVNSYSSTTGHKLNMWMKTDVLVSTMKKVVEAIGGRPQTNSSVPHV